LLRAWNFLWQAPDTPGTYYVQAAGNSVNLNGAPPAAPPGGASSCYSANRARSSTRLTAPARVRLSSLRPRFPPSFSSIAATTKCMRTIPCVTQYSRSDGEAPAGCGAPTASTVRRPPPSDLTPSCSSIPADGRDHGDACDGADRSSASSLPWKRSRATTGLQSALLAAPGRESP
jgi:hypothetical protein